MEHRSLREALSDWTDWDWAGYKLGICLGLMPPEPTFGRAKHVFWSNHPVGNVLYRMLDELVALSVLEKRDEPDIQYRWNPAFQGSWE
jgi:hypothetical protein